ncbi:MAG: TetR-like C-terminal domain-containing protein [Pseudomonadota bacterium]|nr:TetR-like C-terminal domain-containing protein [Pseudomonadota bacterium]
MPFSQASRPVRALHERAIDMAIVLIERRQTHNLRLEDVADALGEPIEKLTRLFSDEDALLAAVVEHALIILIDNCTRVVVRVDPNDPVGQFCALGDAYLDWADAHQAQFRLVSDHRMSGMLARPELRRYVDSITELMTRMLIRAQKGGQLHHKEDIPLMVLSARSFAYGLARMIVDGRMAEWAPEALPVDTAKRLAHDFVLRMARSSQPSRPGA